MLFLERRDAGQRLAAHLVSYRDEHPIVLALPRGGVVVGYEVARELDVPLDVIVARKLGAPHHPELASVRSPKGTLVSSTRQRCARSESLRPTLSA